MKKIYQKSFAILMILAILVPVQLAFFTHYLQLKKIRKEVKQQLINDTPSEDLVSFQFHLNDVTFKSLYWEHSKEFEFEGKMFDVLEADTVGNLVYYVCFPDNEETLLKANFRSKVLNQYSKDQRASNSAWITQHLLLSLYCQAIQNPYESKKVVELYALVNFASFYEAPINISSPPPDIFWS